MTDPVPFLLTTNLMTLGAAAAWYGWPALKKLPAKEAMTILLLPHTMRFIGLLFAAEGAVQQTLPPEFAVPAVGGDVAAAVLAWIALLAIRGGWPARYSLAGVAHGVGLVDLVYAISMGALYGAGTDMGSTIWIPTMLVPILLVTHGLAFALLLTCKQRHRSEQPDPALATA